MKININPVIEDNEIAETKSYKMYSHILEALSKSEYLTLDTTSIQKEYPNIEFPETTDLNVIFKRTDKELLDSLQLPEETSGAFILNDEKGLLLGDEGYLDSFNVIIFIDDEKMEKYVEHETFLDMNINDSLPIDMSREYYLNAFLNTLTHEIEHAIEFIENAGGLTPFEVKEMNDSGKFDYDAFACMSGYGMEKYLRDYDVIDQSMLDNDLSIIEVEDDIIHIVEQRVEENSQKKLESLNLDLLSIYKTEPEKQKKKKNTLSTASLSI